MAAGLNHRAANLEGVGLEALAGPPRSRDGRSAARRTLEHVRRLAVSVLAAVLRGRCQITAMATPAAPTPVHADDDGYGQ